MPQLRSSAVDCLRGLILPLAFSPHSVIVQQALEAACCGTEQNTLANELKFHVCELAISPHGSEVLQTCLEVMPPKAACFIAQEVAGTAAVVARDEHGCNVMCRLLEHLPSKDTASLVSELLYETPELCKHTTASCVVQHILEYGLPQHQRQICEMIVAFLPIFVRHPIARLVVETAETCCVDPTISAQITGALVSAEDSEESQCEIDLLPHGGEEVVDRPQVTTLMIEGILYSNTQGLPNLKGHFESTHGACGPVLMDSVNASSPARRSVW